MNNPDHISESLETIFGVKILNFFDADPVSGRGTIRIRDIHPGSATLSKCRAIQKEASVDSVTNNSKLPVKVGADNINNNLGTTKT